MLPAPLVAEDSVDARAGCRALGRRIPGWCKRNPETCNTSKALWRGPVVSCSGGLAVMAQEANS